MAAHVLLIGQVISLINLACSLFIDIIALFLVVSGFLFEFLTLYEFL